MKFIDFALVKREVSFASAIELLGLRLKFAGNQWRGQCPTCGGDDRSLVVTAAKGFFCHVDDTGGDVIGFAKHVLDLPSMRDAAFELADRAGLGTGTSSTSKSTSRQVPSRTVPESERAKAPRPRDAGKPSSASHPFDPEAFWAKCQYTDEVADLGISEEEAEALLIGFYRGKLYCALRYGNGQVAGFSAFANGELKLPANLLPMSNVVPLAKRRA